MRSILSRVHVAGSTLGLLAAKVASCLLFAALACNVNGQQTLTDKTAKPAHEQKIRRMATPLSFVQNAGQDPTQARYVAHGPGYSMRLSSGSVELSLSRSRKAPERAGNHSDLEKAESNSLNLSFAGANPNATLESSDLLPGTESYFVGTNHKDWHTGLPTYAKLHYREIYPGIDLTFHGGSSPKSRGSKEVNREDSQLEYDIELQPHADAGQVGIELGQAARAEIDKDGNLQLSVGGSPLRFLKPVAWQGTDRKSVQVGYRLKPARDGAPAVLSFETGKYDHEQPLIIDPVLSYATDLNLYSETAMTVDGSGNVYLTGSDPSNSGFDVLKFSPAGALLYTTVIQSTSSTTGLGASIAVDSAGEAYVAGAAATGFPTTSTAYQSQNGYSQSNTNEFNAYVIKLNAAGSTIMYASYLGGSNSPNIYGDTAFAVALDSAGNAYVTGTTYSPNFPTTTGAFQTSFPGNGGVSTAFVAKFNPTLSGAQSLVYSTLLGDQDTAEGGIAVDSAGYAYLAGNASNYYNLILAATPGAFTYNGLQSSYNSGAYLTKLNTTGSGLIYSAYLGAGYSTGVAVDGSGDAYVTGQVEAEDFPTTSGAYQTSYPGGFVVELNPTGSSELYSTFLGGPSGVQNSTYTTPQSIAIAPNCPSSCPVYIAGYASGVDFPQINSIQSVSVSPNTSAFLVSLNGTGSAATLSTYVTGIGSYIPIVNSSYFGNFNSTPSVGVDSVGNAYYAANLSAADFPVTTPNAATAPYYPFLAKIAPTVAAALVPVPNSALNLGQTVTGTNSAIYNGAATTVTIRNAGSVAASISSITTSSAIFNQTNTCGSSIAAGGQCAIALSFTPTADGTINGSVSIASNVSGSPLTISLTGTGIDGSYLQVTPTSLSFSTQAVGTSSAFQTVTIKNTGNQAISTQGIYSLNLPPGFNTLNNCPASLAAGQICAFGVQFAPYQPGYLNGTFYIYSPNIGYAGTISVAGTGIISGNAGALTLSSTALNFNTLAVGLVSPVQYLSITNTGTIPVTVNSYSATLTSATGASTDFTLSPYNCGAPPIVIQPQGACSLSVSFTPSVTATETATLSIPNSTGTTASLVLSGTGTADTQTLVFTPANFVFPDQAVGTTGTNQYFYAANTGNYPVSVDRVFASGDFTLVNASCAATSISPAPAPGLLGGYCYVVVAFSPTATGNRTGSITFVDTAGGTQTLSLSGNGITPTGSLVVDPAAIIFPAQAVGTTSATQSFSLSNPGNSPVTVNSIGVTGDYSATLAYFPSCGYTLPCVLSGGTTNQTAANIAFTPTSTTNPRTGTLTINSSAGVQTISLTGTGETATTAVALTPAIGSTLSFGSQQSGTSSNYLNVYLRNVGTTPVTIPNLPTVTGNYSNAYYYGGTNSCGYYTTTLQPGANCVAYLQFSPTTTGTQTGVLTFTDSAGTQKLNLTGTGAAATPTTYFAESAFTFPQTPVGDTATYYSPDYGNNYPEYFYYTGSTSLTIASASVTAGGSSFSISLFGDNCTGATISSGSDCSFYVNFAPTAAGYFTGTVTLTDTSNVKYTLPLYGYSPTITDSGYLSPDGLVFTTQAVGTIASSQLIYLNNSGTTDMTVGTVAGTNVGSGSEFPFQSDGCSGTVVSAVSGSCAVSVQFAPSATGSRSGQISIPVTYSDGTTGTFTANLTGTGSTPANKAILSPTSSQYPDTAIGTSLGTSYNQAFTLSNLGTLPLNVGQLTGSNVIVGTTHSGDYTVSDSCSGVTVAAGASCSVTVNFAPLAGPTGARAGSIIFPVLYSGGSTVTPFTAAFTGNAVVAGNGLVVTPSNTQLGTWVVGVTSSAASITLSNTGNVPVMLGKPSIAAPFGLQNNCSATLAANTSCNIQVAFRPTVTGVVTGTLTIPSNAPGGTRTVTMSGTGLAATQQLVFSQSSIAFGKQLVSTASNQISLSLINQSAPSVLVKTISLSGSNAADFAVVSDGCTGVILSGQSSCAVVLDFAPASTSLGTRTASISETDSGTGGPRSVSLTGSGINPTAAVGFYPATVIFGSQNIGTTSPSQTFSVTNTGSASLKITTVTSTGSAEFVITSNACNGVTLAAGADCLVAVTFAPTSGGSHSGTISVADNVSGSPQTLTLTGLVPQAALTPTSLAFGSQNVGTSSNAQTSTLTNAGTGTLSIASIAVGGTGAANFSSTNNCGNSVSAGSSCTISVLFAPTASGSLTASITVTDNAGLAAGSAQTLSLSGTGTPVTATPTFTPAAGTYASTQSVTIADSTSGATIYYTLNGTTPTTSSTVYSGPITVSASETIEAIATASGYSQSAVATAAYTITLPAATPTFTPAAGTYASTQSVTIADSTSGATIYYTLNGTTPTTSSTVYSGPITVSASETIEAIATASGYSQSAVATAAYTISLPAATPTFTPAAGTYSSTQSVTIADSTSGATIYYTLNGTTPTTSSSVYSGPITVSASETIEAIATASGYSQSAVATAAYTITLPAATPTFTPAAGTYASTQSVTIADATSGATIYYTLNGTTPTTSSTVYSGPITVSASETIEAIATASGYSQSAVATAAYTITLPAATPTFTPAAGTYSSTQSVTIADSTSGATIYYTLNGTTPTTSSTVYSGPITVSASETIEAIATASGYSQSAVATAAYTISSTTATPVLSPAAGTYMTPQTVTITDSTSGASIYYTVNGATPTASSTLYSGPITVAVTETVKALAIAAGYPNSAVASATYTLHAATPVFTTAAGTYSSAQSVTITDASPGVSIYYTTDGTTPTTSSTLYNGAITVSANETLKALATASGYTASSVASAAYKFVPATPVFTPPPGSYVGAQSVTISDATAGVSIYYTTNATTPTSSSTPYTGPVTLSGTSMLKAIAIAGSASSAVASGTYTIQTQVTAPVFTPAAGTYTGAQSITISDTTSGATIYYTTNGTTPTTSSTVYSGPITVSATETLKALATASGLTNSSVVTAAYTIH